MLFSVVSLLLFCIISSFLNCAYAYFTVWYGFICLNFSWSGPGAGESFPYTFVFPCPVVNHVKPSTTQAASSLDTFSTILIIHYLCFK